MCGDVRIEGMREQKLTLSCLCPRLFNEMTSGRSVPTSSPASYSPSPTRRSLSPSPAFLTTGFIPPSPLRGRTQSFGSNSQQQQPVAPQAGHGTKQHVSVWGCGSVCGEGVGVESVCGEGVWVWESGGEGNVWGGGTMCMWVGRRACMGEGGRGMLCVGGNAWESG